jgi:enamine deaminase RidA (YjgF/YER057c/UK114 family)
LIALVIASQVSSHASPGYRFADVVGNRLYVAGQVPVDAAGQVVSAADAGAQCRQCLDNLQVLIEQHGFALADIHQLTIYVVGDVAALHAAWGEAVAFFESNVPPATLLGVTVLGYENQLVELDAHIERA